VLFVVAVAALVLAPVAHARRHHPGRVILPA
jgi:hypothetical protein